MNWQSPALARDDADPEHALGRGAKKLEVWQLLSQLQLQKRQS